MKSVCLKFVSICLGLAILSACGGGESAPERPDVVADIIPNSNPSQTIAGTISSVGISAVDSDVNDNNAIYTANDFLVSAQAIPDVITLGGYVNVAEQGPQGRSYAIGDTDDYFSSFLPANQTISISFDNDNNQASLDLYLLNSQANVVDQAIGITGSATLTTTSQDKYYIHVHISSGAASYVLNIPEPTINGNISLLSADHVSEDFVPGDVIVKFKSHSLLQKTMSAVQRAQSVGLQHKGGSPDRSMLFNIGGSKGRKNAIQLLGINQSAQRSANALTQSKLDTIAVVNSLRQRVDVESARLNYIRRATAIPDDTHYDKQWHYQNISLPQAWDITTGSAQVTVAVIDTGVILDHPELQGKLVSGYDFIRDISKSIDGDGIDDNPNDDGDGGGVVPSSFHGTHVAGTIAAASNNGSGVAGIAWNINIMPLRALGLAGSGTDYDIEQAIRYAAGLSNDSNTLPAVPADIINLSLGGPINNGSTAAPEAFRLAREAGVIIIAAAGNESSNGLNYPASLDGVVSVSAVDFDNQLAPYSNFGSTIDLSAPGGDTSVDINDDGYPDGVLSTWADDSNGSLVFLFAFFQGTSMAAPHVAGVAALMRSVDPSLSPDEFDQLLSSGAITDDLGANGRDDQFGYGLINAFKAVSEASTQGGAGVNSGDAQAIVSPELLNFSQSNNVLQVQISKQGTGNLRVLNLSSNISWISFSPLGVDNDGFGTYTVSVDRVGLAQNTYLEDVVITTDNGSDTSFPIVMQVLADPSINNAGVQHVSLIDNVNNVVQTLAVQATNGVYSFQFNDVAPGTYQVIANSDNNANSDRCGITEICGTYRDSNNSEFIVIENSDRLDLNFTTGYTQP